MLGWNISVYRLRVVNSASKGTLLSGQALECALSKAATLPRTRIAVWQTGLDGLDWIDEIVKSGQGIARHGGGYPDHYFVRAPNLLRQILDGPPHAREVWVLEPTDSLLPNWEGKTVIDRSEAARCSADEWLLVEAWDES